MTEPAMLTAAEMHDWAERKGIYIPLTPRGTAYLRSLLRTWAGLNRTDSGWEELIARPVLRAS